MMMMMKVLDVALGEDPDATHGIEPGMALGVVLDAEPVAAPTPAPIVEPCVALGVAPVLYERLQRYYLRYQITWSVFPDWVFLF
jgi:hypothetical protein